MDEADPGGHLTIGELASQTQLTARALRHYDEVGLLRPTRVDPRNGYRLYAHSQVLAARRIAALRGLGMGIDEVRAAIEAGEDTGALATVLEQHRSRLRVQATAVSSQLAAVEALLLGGDGASDFAVRTADLAPTPVVTIRWRGAPDDPELYTPQRWAAFDRELGATGGQSLGMIALVHAFEPGVLIDVEMGFVTTELVAPTETYSSRVLDGGRFACATYRRWEEKAAAYVALDEWLSASGSTVCLVNGGY